MLLRYGMGNQGLQLILLTPQSTHAIDDAEDFLEQHMRDFPGRDYSQKKQMLPPRP